MNFLKSYWWGEVTLARSFWLVGFCVGLMFAVLGQATKFVALHADIDGAGLFALSVLNWLLVLVVLVWQIVGLWRAATRYRRERGGRVIWAWLAKAMAVLGLLEFGVVFVTVGLPQATELFRVGFRGDPAFPDYLLNLEEDGTELHVAGGIKFGLTHAVARILAANPSVKTINLTSLGGRVSEAARLYRLIRSRGLNAVSNDHCLSACTYIFAAGRNRWLGGDARLGFHNGAFVGLSAAMIDDAQHDIFARIIADDQVPASFFEHVSATPAEQIWYPTRDELLANHYLTEKRSGAVSSRHALEAQLIAAAAKQQATLPQKFGERTTLSEVKAEGTSLLYVYDVGAPLDGYFLSPSFQKTVTTQIRGNACGKAEMRTAIELGVSYIYRYRAAANRRLLYELAVNSCQ